MHAEAFEAELKEGEVSMGVRSTSTSHCTCLFSHDFIGMARSKQHNLTMKDHISTLCRPRSWR